MEREGDGDGEPEEEEQDAVQDESEPERSVEEQLQARSERVDSFRVRVMDLHLELLRWQVEIQQERRKLLQGQLRRLNPQGLRNIRRRWRQGERDQQRQSQLQPLRNLQEDEGEEQEPPQQPPTQQQPSPQQPSAADEQRLLSNAEEREQREQPPAEEQQQQQPEQAPAAEPAEEFARIEERSAPDSEQMGPRAENALLSSEESE